MRSDQIIMEFDVSPGLFLSYITPHPPEFSSLDFFWTDLAEGPDSLTIT